MPNVIDAELCIQCAACADICPEQAISEGDGAYAIDPGRCTDCGACESECPEEAIGPA